MTSATSTFLVAVGVMSSLVASILGGIVDVWKGEGGGGRFVLFSLMIGLTNQKVLPPP